MRYRIDLQYDGSNYHGWQIQPNAITVEETIEKALGTLLRSPIDVVGCGRTDTGVHASFFTAHFDFELPVNTEELLHKLRQIIAPDIGILNIRAVSPDFHARFSAQSRSYVYQIQFRNNPFTQRFSFLFLGEIDISLMNISCSDLVGEHSFSAFCKGNPSGEHYRCRVTEAHWKESAEGISFHITANRFLRNMVRAIVGTQLDIGRGRISREEHQKLISGGTRSEAGISVPAKGLFLTEVTY
jgi:tRNA pseudouridine38-40 synthase